MRFSGSTSRSAPVELPSPFVPVPGVPQAAGFVAPATVAAMLVFLVHGDRMRIFGAPDAVSNVMTVGPVYRQPGRGTSAARSLRVSFFSSVLVGGMSMVPL